ncbi:hypothetical protein FRC09_003186 [Ceratobasidium sp. 395]|nr:hypothetical protein FRC09_003186 [Ceratobasidium sp. 395]
MALAQLRAHAGRPSTRPSRSPAQWTGIHLGKHFGRSVDSNPNFIAIVDYGLEMYSRRDTNTAEPEDENSVILRTHFTEIETAFNTVRNRRVITPLKENLRGADIEVAMQFREDFCAGLGGGLGQGRSDDITELKKLLLRHPETRDCAPYGWSNDKIAELLRTESIDLDNDEVREQLRTNVNEAASNELFAALYKDHVFPPDDARALNGFLRSEIYIAVLRTIFAGLGSASGGKGSGKRSKAARHKFTALNKPALAYAAMLLRFVLHSPREWYSISDPETDHRYNYDTFYCELIAFMDQPIFAAGMRDLIDFLNLKVFPNSHHHPRRVNLGGRGMARIVTNAVAAAAAAQAEAAGPQPANA